MPKCQERETAQDWLRSHPKLSHRLRQGILELIEKFEDAQDAALSLPASFGSRDRRDRHRAPKERVVSMELAFFAFLREFSETNWDRHEILKTRRVRADGPKEARIDG